MDTISYQRDSTLYSLEIAANFVSGELVLMENLRFKGMGRKVNIRIGTCVYMCVRAYMCVFTCVHVCLAHLMRRAALSWILKTLGLSSVTAKV